MNMPKGKPLEQEPFLGHAKWIQTLPHGMCYSHFGNGFRNGAISIMQLGFINDRYKINPVGQCGKILEVAMGFVDHLGP